MLFYKTLLKRWRSNRDWEALLEQRAEFDQAIYEHRRRTAKKRERREREHFAAQLLKRAEGNPEELARSLEWHPWLAEFIEAARKRAGK